MAVTRDTIVEASIRILIRDGAEGLSMRTLAKELEIKAASLYWHFSGKQELYGAITEYLCERYTMPKNSESVRHYLDAAYFAYREMLLTVRDSVVIFENSVPVTPRRIEIIKAISGKLLETGVLPENLMTVSNMFNNYVLSFTADEMRFKNTSPETLESFMNSIDPEHRFMFTSDRNFEQQFQYGLEILFAGINAV